MKRKFSLKPFLKQEYKSLCKEPVDKASDYLFGDDLPKILKDVKEKNAITEAITKTPHFYTNDYVDKQHPYQHQHKVNFLYQRGRSNHYNYR